MERLARATVFEYPAYLLWTLSIDFLKELLNLARDVVTAEQVAPPIEQEERGKEALTELFDEVKNSETPIIVERVVADIDEIVCVVRFDGWQDTHAGEREIRKALRKTLFKYKLHQEPWTARARSSLFGSAAPGRSRVSEAEEGRGRKLGAG